MAAISDRKNQCIQHNDNVLLYVSILIFRHRFVSKSSIHGEPASLGELVMVRESQVLGGAGRGKGVREEETRGRGRWGVSSWCGSWSGGRYGTPGSRAPSQPLRLCGRFASNCARDQRLASGKFPGDCKPSLRPSLSQAHSEEVSEGQSRDKCPTSPPAALISLGLTRSMAKPQL